MIQEMIFSVKGQRVKVFFERIPDRLVIIKTELWREIEDNSFKQKIARQIIKKLEKQGLFLVNRCPIMKSWMESVRYRKRLSF